MSSKSHNQKENNLGRRKFIKQSAITASVFSIVPSFVLGGSRHIPPSDTLYLAGIGAGGKGASDLTECAKSPNVKVSFLCDVDDRQAVNPNKIFLEQSFTRTSGKCWI